MKNKLISFIIPVYNSSGTIEKCVSSIALQKNKDYDTEIILINDGSKDDSLDKCLQLKKLYNNIIVETQYQFVHR